MPESRGRPRPKKKRRDEHSAAPAPAAQTKTNPTWWAPVMVTLMVIGVLWVAVYYITGGDWPVAAIGAWNLGVGMGLLMAGFLMTTRWH